MSLLGSGDMHSSFVCAGTLAASQVRHGGEAELMVLLIAKTA